MILLHYMVSYVLIIPIIISVADILMVIYLTVIGFYDKIYDGKYFVHAHEWESSYVCTLIGIIAVISSEVRTTFFL